MTKTRDFLRYINEAMARAPKSAPVAALMRHAERPKIPEGESGNELLLTERGRGESAAAGKLMKGKIARLLSSPVPRCRQTADLVRQGAGYTGALEEWEGLQCGVYAPNFKSGKSTLHRLVQEPGFYDIFIDRLSNSGDERPYQDLARPFSATVELVSRVFGGQKSGLCLAVTHDWIVNVAVAYATGKPTRRDDGSFSDFLDTLFVWRAGGRWRFYYKGNAGVCPPAFGAALAGALKLP